MDSNLAFSPDDVFFSHMLFSASEICPNIRHSEQSFHFLDKVLLKKSLLPSSKFTLVELQELMLHKHNMYKPTITNPIDRPSQIRRAWSTTISQHQQALCLTQTLRQTRHGREMDWGKPRVQSHRPWEGRESHGKGTSCKSRFEHRYLELTLDCKHCSPFWSATLTREEAHLQKI